MQKNRQLDACVTSWKQDFVSGKQKVFYEISIDFSGNKWELRKRFSDFADLHKALLFHFSNLPVLPKKTLFALKKPADLEKRKMKLEIYIREIVKREEFYANDNFIKFFEVIKIPKKLFFF